MLNKLKLAWRRWRVAWLEVRLLDCRTALSHYALRDFEKREIWQQKMDAAEEASDQFLRRVLGH